MTITREINGSTISIELTSRELYEAYREQQNYFDICDVRELADWLAEDGEEPYTDEEVEQAAHDMRELFCDPIGQAHHDAAETALHNLRY